jgi:hypothetical protein
LRRSPGFSFVIDISVWLHVHQKVSKQALDQWQRIFQAMVAIDQVQQTSVLLREPDYVVRNDNIVTPPMHDRSVLRMRLWILFRLARQIERRREQKKSNRLERGACDRHQSSLHL